MKWFSRGRCTYWKCTLCSTLTTLPVPTSSQINNHYKDKFKTGNYLLARQFSDAYLLVYQQFVDVISSIYKESKEKLKGKKLLDVGCFTGDFLELISHSGVQVYGTELQTEAVRIANQKLPGRIFQADIATKNFPKKKFDIITLLGVIEHVTDPGVLLRSTTDLLTNEGLLVIQTPDSGSVLAKMMGKWWPPLAPIEHIHIFSSQGLIRFLSHYGYTDIQLRQHIKPLPIAYVYRQFSNFGTHFRLLLWPIGWLLSRLPDSFSLPFYGGEMIITARLRKQVKNRK